MPVFFGAAFPRPHCRRTPTPPLLHASPSVRRIAQVEWFTNKLKPPTENGTGGSVQGSLRRRFTHGFSLNLTAHHFERQCESIVTSSADVLSMQDILRILKLDRIGVGILAAVAGAPAAHRLKTALYSFLKRFCHNNPKNQAALYAPESLRLFVSHLPDNVGAEAVLLAVFEGNYELCTRPNQQVCAYGRGEGDPRSALAKGGGGGAQPRWAVCATGAGAHQGQTSREGEKDIWWTAGTARGGTGHLGLTHTETQRGRLWTACGQRRVGSKNSQTTPATTSTTPNTPTTGRR